MTSTTPDLPLATPLYDVLGAATDTEVLDFALFAEPVAEPDLPIPSSEFDTLLALAENPPSPTPALIDLFRRKR